MRSDIAYLGASSFNISRNVEFTLFPNLGLDPCQRAAPMSNAAGAFKSADGVE
jgi:hypothetical protein